MNVTVLYGSETGTAQDVAEEIWKSAKRKGLRSSVSSMDDYDPQKLPFEKLIIFVVATTGQGDTPTNMKKFWRLLLRKSLGPTALAHLKYALLGLGDSSYSKFNFAAKKLDKRLLQLGGEPLVPIGLADDQHDLGIDGTADPWRDELWTRIEDVFHVATGTENDVLIERFDVSVANADTTSNQSEEHSPMDIYTHELSSRPELRVAVVAENTRTTTEDHFQDVRLIKLRSNDLNYEPGDVVYVRPKNSKEQVRRFFKVLNDNGVQLHPGTRVTVSEKEIRVPEVLRQDLTLGQVAEQYWDLNFKPRRSTMRALWYISENELEKEKLHEFTTAAGQEELYSYINRPRRNVLEFLTDFPHTTGKINAKVLFEIMAPIKPRAFSIASSCKATKDQVHLLVAVVRYKTRLYEPRFGLCSTWLASLDVGEKVIVWFQKGTFKFNAGQPMILIGPGTGLAPFRSLLLEKESLGEDLSDCALFFGCRNKEKDYHCKEDLERLREKGLKLFHAFSRDQPEKIYVQHVLYQERGLCWDFLERGGGVYLAGSSKNMPNCVRDEFLRIARERRREWSDDEAERFIQQLEKTNRYQSETWA